MWRHEPDVTAFVTAALQITSEKHPDGWNAIEFGSFVMHDHDARPTARSLGCGEYVGVDWRAGPGVDLECMNSEAPDRLGDRRFDLSISISALEHDPDWKATLSAMLEALHPGGVAAVTVPVGDWPPHEIDCAPLGGTFYENRTAEDVLGAFEGSGLLGEVLRCGEDASIPGRRRTNVVVTRRL